MQRIRHFLCRLDPGYLVVILLCLVAIWPFLSRSGLPQETDAELHVFRLHELGQLVRVGELYPRWAPNFYHGYGYPIFNYYAPLTYYLGLGVELLPWFDAAAGVKAVFVLGLLLAGLAMYGFVRDQWGRRPAYVAVSSYLYSPYILYIDPHARGVLAESFSFGLFPLALWGFSRLRCKPSATNLILSVFAVAALILTHNLMGLLFFALLAGWLAWTFLSGRRISKGGRIGYRRPVFAPYLLGALLMGLGAAAIFWLPVLLEREAVNLDTLLGRGDNFDFRTHFLSIRELLSASPGLDWSDTQPAYRFSLGLPQWLLGAAGAALLLANKVKHRSRLIYFSLALLLILFMMLPISTLLWETVPLLPYFQFPWRLLGPAAALLAILGGAATEALLNAAPLSGGAGNAQSGRKRFRGTAVALALLSLPFLFALPLTQPAPWPEFGEVSSARMSQIEQHGRWLGTTSAADFVPAGVAVIPDRNGDLVSGIIEGKPLDRVNRAVGMIPSGATVTGEAKTPLRTIYTVSSPEPFLLRLFQFYFPGWVVEIDGKPVEIQVAEPEGFMVVPVPSGSHQVLVDLKSTPPQTAGTVLSGLALVLMLVLAFRLRFAAGRQPSAARHDRPAEHVNAFVAAIDRPAIITVAALTAITLLIIQPLGLWRFQSPPYEAEPAAVSMFADFGDQIALIGYDASATSVEAGEKIEVVLYWQAKSELNINYQVFLHLLGPDGSLLSQSDKLNPGDFPTRRWPTDRYVRDAHHLEVPADLPSGQYRLSAGLWVQNEGWRLPLFDEAGEQIGDAAALFALEVEG